MKFTPAHTAVDVLAILKSYRDNLREKTLYEPSWPVLERLISRDTEMSPVWHDIARHALTGEQCWNLLAQIFLAGVYGTAEHHRRLKSDHSRLSSLNEGIAAKAAELGRMLTEREEILNRNAFYIEHTSHIVDLIDAASGQNGHYSSFCVKSLKAFAASLTANIGRRCSSSWRWWRKKKPWQNSWTRAMKLSCMPGEWRFRISCAGCSVIFMISGS